MERGFSIIVSGLGYFKHGDWLRSETGTVSTAEASQWRGRPPRSAQHRHRARSSESIDAQGISAPIADCSLRYDKGVLHACGGTSK